MATSCSEHSHSLEKRLEVAEELLAKAYGFRIKGIIQGIQRIEKQTKAEIAMLKKVSDLVIILSEWLLHCIGFKLLSGQIPVKKHHLNSTNLLHLEGVLHLCEHASQVIAVDRSHRFTMSGVEQVTTIDIVCNGGSMWIKLFGRKRSALHKKWKGMIYLLCGTTCNKCFTCIYM